MITVHVAAAPAVGVQRCVLCGLVTADVAAAPNPLYCTPGERIAFPVDERPYLIATGSDLGSNEVMCR